MQVNCKKFVSSLVYASKREQLYAWVRSSVTGQVDFSHLNYLLITRRWSLEIHGSLEIA